MTIAETGPSHSKLLRIIEHPAVKIAIPLVIATIAIVVLHKLASHVKWVDVKADLASASRVSPIRPIPDSQG